uniref:Mediator of DNA damage checkpoint protein 1 n=1 Tax=Lygus hesperus TaxID=30085 RepID=A0A0A9W1W1_LYGHE
MRISWVFASIFCSMIALAFTNRLNPCLTVVLMDTHRDARWSKIDIKSYPIAVCIAGYSSYDFYHRITDKNGTRHLGIFGIREDNLEKCDPSGLYQITDDDFKPGTDMLLLLHREMLCLENIELKSIDKILFYAKLCQPHLVVNVTCSLSSGGIINVYDPINKDLADRIYRGETDLNDELITGITKTSTTEMVHSKESARTVTLEPEPQTSTTQKPQDSTLSDEANKKPSSAEIAHSTESARTVTLEPEPQSSSTTQKPQTVITIDSWNAHKLIVTIILLTITCLLGTVVYFLMGISKNQKRIQASARYDNNFLL